MPTPEEEAAAAAEAERQRKLDEAAAALAERAAEIKANKEQNQRDVQAIEDAAKRAGEKG